MAAEDDGTEHAQLYAIAFDVHEYMLDRAVEIVRKGEDALDLWDSGLLGKHEWEILYWTREGYPTKEVSQMLALTVNQYLHVVKEKLGYRTKFEAAIRASRYGLLLGSRIASGGISVGSCTRWRRPRTVGLRGR